MVPTRINAEPIYQPLPYNISQELSGNFKTNPLHAFEFNMLVVYSELML